MPSHADPEAVPDLPCVCNQVVRSIQSAQRANCSHSQQAAAAAAAAPGRNAAMAKARTATARYQSRKPPPHHLAIGRRKPWISPGLVKFPPLSPMDHPSLLLLLLCP